MTGVNASELQGQIKNLQAQITELSQQLMIRERVRESARVLEVAPQPEVAAVERTTAHAVESSRPDHSRSLRTLCDLLWQGRHGLAFHLTRSLETQRVEGLHFDSTTIRAWALVSQADRRSPEESLGTIDAIFNSQAATEQATDSLASRMFRFAALVGLVGAIDPQDVRGRTARFQAPPELPATGLWWTSYTEFLATAPRRTTQWRPLPEQPGILAELDALMLNGVDEPLRLAASCLTMAVRQAKRHVRTANHVDANDVLNSELSRSTRISFTDRGEALADAVTIERTICNLVSDVQESQAVNIAEGPRTTDVVENDRNCSPATSTIVASPPDAIEPPTPRAQLAMSRLEAVEETLQSALAEESLPPAVEPLSEDPVRVARREAARARLQGYSERVSARDGDDAPATVPFRTLAIDEQALESVTAVIHPALSMKDTQSAAPGATPPRNPSVAILIPTPETAGARMPVQAPTSPANTETIALNDRRGIHAGSVATAFGTEAGRPSTWAAAPSTRRTDRRALSSILFNPQAAVIACLLVIGCGIVAGLGVGLNASSNESSSTASTSAKVEAKASNSEEAGDFQTTQ